MITMRHALSLCFHVEAHSALEGEASAGLSKSAMNSPEMQNSHCLSETACHRDAVMFTVILGNKAGEGQQHTAYSLRAQTMSSTWGCRVLRSL
jgi:hypothetical protein